MDAKTKAILIAEGLADIDPGLLDSPKVSTAGPGAGISSFFFRSGSHRVRLEARRDPDARLKVRRVSHEGDEVGIFCDGEEIVRGTI
ncbi:hypothetical protein KAT92_00440, partial [Candidatus Babeliales bacterium]|nr:hypothetical protein [Candidatus Babeliales bacterium]